jgi:DnaJ-class molecular chaperone
MGDNNDRHQWCDYDAILQVSPKANPVVVAGAYTRLAKKYHPDTGGDKTGYCEADERRS